MSFMQSCKLIQASVKRYAAWTFRCYQRISLAPCLPPLQLRKQGDTEMLAAAHEATPVAMRTLLMRRNLNAALPTAQRQAKEQEVRAGMPGTLL